MFESYFDPDRYIPVDNDGSDYDALLEALKGHDTGRWITQVTLSGKDADLDPCGQQGFDITDCNDEKIYLTGSCGKTVAGTDVCLNVPDDEYEKAREVYLENAFEVVCGFPFAGEWSGDDWYLSDEFDLSVEWVMDDETGEPDYKATAVKVVAAFGERTKRWNEEARLMDGILDRLAGWSK